MSTCQNCGFDKIPKDKLKCPKCGINQLGPETARDTSVLLKDVKSSDIDRIDIGPCSVVFGTNFQTGESGIARSSVNLLAGAPGAGKSTLVLQWADIIAELGEVLYLVAEEPDDQIKSRSDRLGIKNAHKIRLVNLMRGGEDIEGIIRLYKPVALMLDSVSALVGDNMSAAPGICRVIKRFCASHSIPAIVTCHVTKQGDIGGLEALQHEVDSTITFFPDEGEGEDVPRVLHVEKNRNGKAFITFVMIMTETGLVPLMEDENDED